MKYVNVFSRRLALLAATAITLASCEDFEKEVEVELPVFQSQLVVEAYIEKDEQVFAAVMETKDYFSAPEIPFINNATVRLTYGTETYTLKNNFFFDTVNLKYFNYYLPATSFSPAQGEVLQIEVKDTKGRIATAQSQWINPVPLDSVTHEYNSQGEALVLAHFRDPAGTTNYRFRARKLHDTADDFVPDYFADDDLFDGQKSSFGTSYHYEKGDTVEVTLYRLTPEYYDFLSTANAASSANGNPFSQPAAIRSNVKGGTGIFTVLPYDRILYILP